MSGFCGNGGDVFCLDTFERGLIVLLIRDDELVCREMRQWSIRFRQDVDRFLAVVGDG